MIAGSPWILSVNCTDFTPVPKLMRVPPTLNSVPLPATPSPPRAATVGSTTEPTRQLGVKIEGQVRIGDGRGSICTDQRQNLRRVLIRQ